ncbi:hypothetical protein BD847_1749 [Flavobacterium cutihirudinis]|uniref:Lipoprotein n=1 Tax=Flavobacterium cutihirudinis TaxID=1265740 RepID=A0A3D9FW92_9FLAO|nr:hypothetical protein [Flavobacterium cutihirudinis]RED25010.1 hypothetical protein BD847_1749 [Flavobacterium cutihirudinis]
MKQLLLFMMIIMLTSCNSQIDLETLKFDTSISSIVNDSTKFAKDKNIDYGLVAYSTEDIDKFRYGNINISSFSMKDNAKNSLITYTSTLTFYVDNFKNNKLSGLIIKNENENESEGIKLLKHFKTKLGKPLLENHNDSDDFIQSAYLWDNKKNNQVVYITQHTEYFSEEKNRFISTEITILKSGMKLKPREDNNPENIKKILEENPNAFDVLEILKSRFY